MEGEGEVEAHVRELNNLEEIFEDKDRDVFDTVLSFSPVHELKNKLKTLETQGIYVHDVHRSHFHHFCPNQTLNFPVFVAWCTSNYS